MKWNDEPPGMCCANGKVNVPLLGPPPEPLSSLLTGADTASKNFRSMIRLYNSSFQMTSFGTATEGRIIREPGWNPTFKVQGQIYHRIGPLRPPADETAAFLQIYFMQDPEEEADRRLAWQGRTHLDRSLILTLQAMLHSENAYITEFKTQLDRQTEIAAHYRIVIRADRIPVGHHPRTFNTPQCNEVAALVLNSEEAQYRDVVLTSRNNALQRVNEVHVAYDAWQYPLLFPRGEDGYHLEQRLIDPLTKQRTDKKMSVLQFYAFRLMLRPNDFNILLRAGKLSHQFFVDMYVKIETERLSFYRKNQKKLRAENYCHLRDAIKTDDNVRNLGQLVILPSSFTGGPRYMHEKSQDAMTYVKNFGPPELFITITCNPKWPEITNELLPLQTAVDRPDIIARVFYLKMKRFMYLIEKKHLFGRKRCHLYTIEWQKRGLPHLHLLLWMIDKIRPQDIDKIITAELPDPNTDPELFRIVSTTMIHGPCGHINPNSPCMKDGRCTKHYPREFLRATVTARDGYPLYRRRSPEEGGVSVTINGKQIDNRWVVPHNPFLCRTFDAHANVEYCATVKAIKYVCEYINKGKDKAVVALQRKYRNDEITRFQVARYICTSEALWRIFQFPIQDHDPTVQHLQVHLENSQRVYFTPENAEDLAAQPPKTTLTEFFQL